MLANPYRALVGYREVHYDLELAIRIPLLQGRLVEAL